MVTIMEKSGYQYNHNDEAPWMSVTHFMAICLQVEIFLVLSKVMDKPTFLSITEQLRSLQKVTLDNLKTLLSTVFTQTTYFPITTVDNVKTIHQRSLTWRPRFSFFTPFLQKQLNPFKILKGFQIKQTEKGKWKCDAPNLYGKYVKGLTWIVSKGQKQNMHIHNYRNWEKVHAVTEIKTPFLAPVFIKSWCIQRLRVLVKKYIVNFFFNAKG